MENPSSVRNGGIKLPIGFRFRPTDEELVVHYLKRKVHSFPLPASVISEWDVYHTNPRDLPGDPKEKRYFFSKERWNVHKCSRRSSRRINTGYGYWKAIGNDKVIVAPGTNQAIGTKKSLVFYHGKPSHGLRTRWFMHEYRLLLVDSPTALNSTQMEDWGVCGIYQKKSKVKNCGVKTHEHSNINKTSSNMEEVIRASSVMDFMMEDSTDLGPPQPSSSCTSSGITELSSNELDQEETSSAYH